MIQMPYKYLAKRLRLSLATSLIKPVVAVLSIIYLLVFSHSVLADSSSVFLEDLTSVEVAAKIKNGTTTVLIPIGGTEQSGPHLTLGKHNYRVKILSQKIAQALGNTLIAPVLPYVPEGAITPPTSHMRYAGTISISDAAFKSILSSAAKSFKQHGFLTIVFLGDHGGYQLLLKDTATALNKEWLKDKAKVFYSSEYYDAATNGFNAILLKKGFGIEAIGKHAGLADTSLQLAVANNTVEEDKIIKHNNPLPGVDGDPSEASANLGKLGIDLIVNRTVTAIKQFHTENRNNNN